MRHKLGSAVAINKMGGFECQAQAALQVTRSSPPLTLRLTSRGCLQSRRNKQRNAEAERGWGLDPDAAPHPAPHLCSCPGGAHQWSGPESR